MKALDTFISKHKIMLSLQHCHKLCVSTISAVVISTYISMIPAPVFCDKQTSPIMISLIYNQQPIKKAIYFGLFCLICLSPTPSPFEYPNSLPPTVGNPCFKLSLKPHIIVSCYASLCNKILKTRSAPEELC